MCLLRVRRRDGYGVVIRRGCRVKRNYFGSKVYGATALALGRSSVWSPRRRERISRIASEIRHWHVFNDRYDRLPDVEATWFIDPPYQGSAGTHYKHGSKALDYAALGAWCQSRRGQVIVCENEGADWLPWNAVIENRPGITKNSDGTARRKIEVAWIR